MKLFEVIRKEHPRYGEAYRILLIAKNEEQAKAMAMKRSYEFKKTENGDYNFNVFEISLDEEKILIVESLEG